jgi:hypothetical protein
MIGTEVVVLLAFISRFSLDRKLTDLREEINQKQIILEANQGFENQFKRLQENLVSVNSLLSKQKKPLDVFYDISSRLPVDVNVLEYMGGINSLEIRFSAGTTESFSNVLKSLQSLTSLSNIEITEIRKDQLTGTVFKITARVR